MVTLALTTMATIIVQQHVIDVEMSTMTPVSATTTMKWVGEQRVIGVAMTTKRLAMTMKSTREISGE